MKHVVKMFFFSANKEEIKKSVISVARVVYMHGVQVKMCFLQGFFCIFSEFGALKMFILLTMNT